MFSTQSVGCWSGKAGWVVRFLQRSVAVKLAGSVSWVCLCACALEHLYPICGMFGVSCGTFLASIDLCCEALRDVLFEGELQGCCWCWDRVSLETL